MVICDSREKKWQHIEKFFQRKGIDYCVKKLDYGDYMLVGNDKLVIDRKASLDELASNLLTKDSGRFWREMRGASSNKMQMVVLIEAGTKYKSIQDVANWTSKYSRLNGQMLVSKMLSVSYAYDVEWVFCKPSESGKKIMEILGNGS